MNVPAFVMPRAAFGRKNGVCKASGCVRVDPFWCGGEVDCARMVQLSACGRPRSGRQVHKTVTIGACRPAFVSLCIYVGMTAIWSNCLLRKGLRRYCDVRNKIAEIRIYTRRQEAWVSVARIGNRQVVTGSLLNRLVAPASAQQYYATSDKRGNYGKDSYTSGPDRYGCFDESAGRMLEERRCQCAGQRPTGHGGARTGTHSGPHPGADAIPGHHDSGLVFGHDAQPVAWHRRRGTSFVSALGRQRRTGGTPGQCA
jgi:hypothetical protein